jgi:hypothetical protein
VVLDRHVSQGIRQCDPGVVRVERVAAIRRTSNSGLEILGFRQLRQLDGEYGLGHLILR